MSIYTIGHAYVGDARATREADLARIIADRPVSLTRTRKTHADGYRQAVTASYGPFVSALAPFRATRNAAAFDEKGSSATAAYVLLALNLPRDVAPGVALFALDDRLTDADGNVYRVTSPARWDGAAVEVNVELLG